MTDLTATGETGRPARVPTPAPAIWMDQRGNYWRWFPKGDPDPEGDTLSIPPTSTENYHSEPVAIYRQGRDLSAQQMQDLLTRIEHLTDDPLLVKVAQSAWYAWTTGRDAITEAELLMQMVAIRIGAEDSNG